VDTIPVRADERFDAARVADFLRSNAVQVGDLAVEQFPAGQSNLTFLLRSGDWEAVLRRPPLGPVPPRAHDVAREFRILQRLHPSFPLAPCPFVLCEDPEVIGAPFYVMERRQGLVLDQDLPVNWDPDPAVHRAIGEALVRVLVDLHAVDWRAAGLDDIGRPDGYLQRQVSGWTERYARARTSDLYGAAGLTRWLEERLPTSPPPTVIHNDYKLNNVLLHPQDPRRITAVVDWEMATLGDPLSDLASLLAYWTEPDETEMLGSMRSVTREPGFPSRQDVAALYGSLSGRDLSNLNWYLAFSYFKVGVILQQIYVRWLRGQTHDVRFAGLGDVAAWMLRRAITTAGIG
jgi:aminoglycoside phosphotransferase (APT) family kinase protein